MKESTKVIIFEDEKVFHLLSPETDFRWTPYAFKVVNPTTDAQNIESS